MKDRSRTRIELLEARIAPAAGIFDVATLDGTNGFRLGGIATLESFGSSVSNAGDVNGDGFDDVIVSTSGWTGPPQQEQGPGTTFVVFGSANGFPSDLNVAALDGTDGFRLTRSATSWGASHIVNSVSGAGDVNGDGFDDIIIGFPWTPKNGPEYVAGESYVVFGKARGFAANVDLVDVNGANGFKITGEISGDLSGYSVSGAGDINGDGFADVIISAHYADNARSYVVFGKASGFPAEFSLSGLDGSNGFKISGLGKHDSESSARTVVSDAGDINGDGFDDVIVGSSQFSDGTGTSSAYVLFGRQSGFAPEVAVSTLDGSNGFKINAVNWAVSGAGDVNGDGFGDVMIGVYSAVDNVSGLTGAVTYVVFGKAGNFVADLDPAVLDGSNGFKLSGAIFRDGCSVSSAGDFNRDGFDDLIIGTRSRTSGASDSYVVFGEGSGLTAAVDLAALTGRNGFRVTSNVALDGFGSTVSGAGDINGDGFDDLIIGAPYGNVLTGASYVIFGYDTRPEVADDGKSITFTDVDGDLVKIEASAGQFARHNVRLAADGTLQLIDLSEEVGLFTGANLTVSAESSGGGDGLVNVGAIDASGVRLGKVTVAGDLGQIDAGDGTEALASLTVRSLGALGAATQAAGTSDPLSSELLGSVGKLSVQRVIANAAVSVLGKVRTVFVGSDVIDASLSAKKIQSFTVMGDLQGSEVIAEISIRNIEVMGRLVSNDATAPALIAAMGKTNPMSAKQSIVFDKIVIHDDVINGQILAGYNHLGEAKNANASIGTVVVKGSWVGSSLVAGVQDMTLDGFGRSDVLIPGGTGLVASIAKIVIEGSATGTSVDGDFFGITAKRLGKLIISGVTQPLGIGPNDILIGSATDDFRAVDFS